MTDREKLLKLWSDIKSIEIPVMDDPANDVIPNTIAEGLKFINEWLVASYTPKNNVPPNR